MINPIYYSHGDGGLHNATSSFASSTELVGPLIIVIYIAGALMAAQFVAPWLARSSILGTIGNSLLTAIAYGFKGLAATAVLAVAALPAYLLLTVDASTRSTGLRYLGYAVGAFVALVAVGWLADRAVERYIRAHPTAESWGDLWPEHEETEAVADGVKQHE